MEKIQPFLTDVICEKYMCDSGYICDFSKSPRPKYVLSYMLKGKATFTSNNGVFTINEGDALFIPMGECYISEWKAETKTECYSIHFSIKYSRSPFFNKSAHIQGLYDCSYLKELFALINKQINSDKPMEIISGYGNFYILFADILGKIKLSNRTLDSEIHFAHSYIDKHYKEKINMEELAKLCKMSVPNFYRKFKAEYQTTPITYKNLLLAERAIELLYSYPEKSIESISEELGFESTVYFRKLFKRATGKNPHEYRKNGLKI